MELMLPASQPRVAQTLRDHAARSGTRVTPRALLWGHGLQDRIWSNAQARGKVAPRYRIRPMTAGSRPAHPGKNLGLPESGPGSLAPMGRRLAALLIDWLISYGLALLALGFGVFSKATLPTAILVIWFLLGVVAVRLFGFTPGQLALNLQVVAVDGRVPVGIGRL